MFGKVLRGSLRHDLASRFPSAGTKIDDPLSVSNDVGMVLHDHECMARIT
jgi:hypothetical protein